MNFKGQPRAVIRQAQRYLRETSRREQSALRPVERAKWPSEFDQSGIPVLGCWRSKDFLAVAYDEKPPAIRLTVLRTVLRDDGEWLDGITWDQLQRIKRECGYGDRDAVEVYPADVDIVNVGNLRHIWILAEPSALTWRADMRARA